MKDKYFMLTIFLICITLGLTVNYYISNKKYMSSYVAELNTLNKTIEQNNRQLESLQSDIAYNSSKEFIEKVARETLGLVMPDEIVFIEN